MTGSSIPVSEDFRDELKARKRDGESYEAYLRRQLGTEDSISDVLAKLDESDPAVQEQFAQLESDLEAATDGGQEEASD